MRLLTGALALLVASSASMSLASSSTVLAESPQEKANRMAWWKEAKYGMFIHWGLYAVPGGKWNGKDVATAGEWILNGAQIKVKDYEPLLKQFNPVKFNADEWVAIAKRAGMKYIVITSKHHDGFALFDSKQTDWDVMSTPYGRDILKQLAAACKKGGIKLCFYHSIMDWHHPDYLPRRPWDPRPEWTPKFERYVDFMKGQLKELLTNYGDIGVLWFDGEWEGTWTADKGVDLYHYVRSLQPKIIVNNRVSKGRSGMAGMTQGDHVGDFGTPEQEIPASGLPGVDWESCMTFNGSWGYYDSDKNWKSTQTIVENLVDIVSKGGNYLLNVGPDALGLIPKPCVDRLDEAGAWLKVNGEAIYGAQPGPLPKPLPWGRITTKGKKMYFHVFAGNSGQVTLSGISGQFGPFKPLAGGASITPRQTPEGITISLPASRSSLPQVYVTEVRGEIKFVKPLVKQPSTGAWVLGAKVAEATGHANYEAAKDCIGFWTSADSTVSWPVRVSRGGRYQVEVTFACEPGSEGSLVEISLTGGRTVMKVTKTKGWSDFVTESVGEIQVKEGEGTLLVKPLKKPGGAVMNLRSVKLVPVR